MTTKTMIQIYREVDASDTDGKIEVVWAPINKGKVRMFCNVADNALVHRNAPKIVGYEWKEITRTRSECSSGFQTILYIDLPEGHSYLSGVVHDNVFFENPENPDDISEYWGLNT